MSTVERPPKMELFSISETALNHLVYMAEQSGFLKPRKPRFIYVYAAPLNQSIPIDKNKRKSPAGISKFINYYLTQYTYIDNRNNPTPQIDAMKAQAGKPTVDEWLPYRDTKNIRTRHGLTLLPATKKHFIKEAYTLNIHPYYPTPNAYTGIMLELIGQQILIPKKDTRNETSNS